MVRLSDYVSLKFTLNHDAAPNPNLMGVRTKERCDTFIRTRIWLILALGICAVRPRMSYHEIRQSYNRSKPFAQTIQVFSNYRPTRILTVNLTELFAKLCRHVACANIDHDRPIVVYFQPLGLYYSLDTKSLVYFYYYYYYFIPLW